MGDGEREGDGGTSQSVSLFLSFPSKLAGRSSSTHTLSPREGGGERGGRAGRGRINGRREAET